MRIPREKKNKPSIIITGHLGYVGSELLKEVKKQNIRCLAIDKEYQGGTEGLHFNLSDYEKTADTIKNFKPDIFIHTGTHSALAYKNDFINSFTEDFQALSSILRSLSPIPDRRLIYFSSSYVCSGLPKNQEVSEESFLRPSHNFGVAKAFFEQFILKNHPQSVIFRLSSVFGQGQAKNPNTILNFARECLEKGEITVWGRGARKLQYVYMNDVIRCIFEGFNMKPGIYNLGGDDYVSVAEAARSVADFYKAKVTLLKDKPEGETLPFLANEKIKSAITGDPFTPFKTALTAYLKSIK